MYINDLDSTNCVEANQHFKDECIAFGEIAQLLDSCILQATRASVIMSSGNCTY